MEIADQEFQIQPREDICEDCGNAIESMPGDPQENVDKARKDKGTRGTVLLLSQIKKGKLPRGFVARVVKTNTSIGQMIEMQCQVVRRDKFQTYHGIFPEECESKKIRNKILEYHDMEGELQKGVAYGLDEEVPKVLEPERIKFFHKLETTMTEYHLQPNEHLQKGQAKR